MHQTLHSWIREHRLDLVQTQQLWRLAGLHQPPSEISRQLRMVLAIVAALLLGAGLIFWVAANWADQSRMFKLHLLQLSVAAPFVLALLARPARLMLRNALVLLATLALGGLLAYIGITYQTGADAWQLFATWAVLAFAAVLVLRSDGLWAMWLLILATAISTWSGQSLIDQLSNLLSWNSPQNLIMPLLWLAVFLFPVLAQWLGLVRDMQGHQVRAVISLRVVAFLATGAWMTYALMFLFMGSWNHEMHMRWINVGYFWNTAFVVLAGWVGWRLRDLVVLALTLLGLNVLGLALLARVMFIGIGIGSVGWLLFASVAAIVVALSGRWLYQQQRQVHHED